MDRLGGYFGAHEPEEEFDDFADDSDADLDSPPSPVGQDERRMQVRAYNHWAGLLGDLNFPHVDDLKPNSLDDFGPFSVLLDFTDGMEDPAVRFVGTELEAECGHDSSMARLSDVPSRSVLSRITDHYMQILANQAPIGFEAEFVNDRDTAVLYRGILLPYSSDNATIDYIFGVINWKEMADSTTADELLLEIDQALGSDTTDETASETDIVETAESFTEQVAENEGDEAELELRNAEMVDNHTPHSLPLPAFGDDDADYEEVGIEETEGRTTKPDRSVDALGNPIGGHVADNEEGQAEYGDDFDTGIKTAADYGLPDWDDELEDDDVEDVVDPLADEETSSSLISLVSRGERNKKSVDLSRAQSAPAVPQAYEAEADHESPAVPQGYELSVEIVKKEEPEADAFKVASEEMSANLAAIEDADEAEPSSVAGDNTISEASTIAGEQQDETNDQSLSTDGEDAPPEGLYDCLAEARELAQAAQNTEDRSRKALYEAVGRAYDFSLEAQENTDGYEELLSDNGLTFQDRAPMTPVVKLVFGADYDKTRLTEYAAVLMHAHRVGVERGTLGTFLREAEGGLKGVLNAERQARKEEQGKPVDNKREVRGNLAKKLRKMEPLALADLDEEGAEFALVMVRRTPEDELIVLGEVPEDVPLVERAARKLLG